VDAIAKALLWCINKPDKSQRLGMRGRLRVLAEYSIEQMYNNYRSRYEQLSSFRIAEGVR